MNGRGEQSAAAEPLIRAEQADEVSG